MTFSARFIAGGFGSALAGLFVALATPHGVAHALALLALAAGLLVLGAGLILSWED